MMAEVVVDGANGGCATGLVKARDADEQQNQN
jgi:hypothetical protein